LLEAEEISRTTLQEAVAISVYSKIQPVRIDGGREAERLCSDPGWPLLDASMQGTQPRHVGGITDSNQAK